MNVSNAVEMIKVLSCNYKGREGTLYYSEYVRESSGKFIVFHLTRVNNITTTYIYLLYRRDLAMIIGFNKKTTINAFFGNYPNNIYDKGIFLLLNRLYNAHYQDIIDFATQSNMKEYFIITSDDYKNNPKMAMINILAHKDSDDSDYIFNRGLLEKFMTSDDLQSIHY